MDAYGLLLFLHVVAATAMFAGWAIECRMVAGRNAPSPADRAALLGPLGMVVAFVSGVVMMVWRWGPQPWMPVAIGGVALLLVIGIGAMVVARRGSASADRSRRIAIASLAARVGVGVGLLAIMAMKPETAPAIALLAAGLVAGLAVAALSPGGRAEMARHPASDPHRP